MAKNKLFRPLSQNTPKVFFSSSRLPRTDCSGQSFLLELEPVCLRYTFIPMNKKIILILIPVLLLTACLTVLQESDATNAPPLFVTSTLPPTRQGLILPTETPLASTETPDPL